LSYSMAPVDGREKLAVDLLLDWARQHAVSGRVQAPDFGLNTDLLKLEARVKIATSWLWLAQRYPDVFEDAEAVVDLRASLNAKIEEKLVATSVSHRRKPDEKAQRDRGKKSQRQRKNRRSWTDADPVEVRQHRARGQ
jgi:ATP-dependent RNA helicase SUPV3L1/SUV3